MPDQNVNASLLVETAPSVNRPLNVADLAAPATGASTEVTLAAVLARLNAVLSAAVTGTVALDTASLAALEVTTDPNTERRYAGGKTAITARVTTASATIVTPPAGMRLRVVWVYAINDPDQAVSPAITVSLGGAPIYLGFAISHWESFTGPVNGALTVSLDSAGDVAFTAHYEVIA